MHIARTPVESKRAGAGREPAVARQAPLTLHSYASAAAALIEDRWSVFLPQKATYARRECRRR